MTAGSARFPAGRLARLERDVTGYAARVLAAETGCQVRPGGRPGRFEVTLPDGALIGTMDMITAWNREARTPGRRRAALREWLAVLGRQGAA